MAQAALSSTEIAPRPAEDKRETPIKTRRVLACVLCQKRKVKCDRRFPCSNCIRASTQCIPATLTPPRRRRRFAERELLERLHHYEALLRENRINFEPLREHPLEHEPPNETGTGVHSPGNAQSSASPSQRQSEEPDQVVPPTYKPKSFWHVMNQTQDDNGFQDLDHNKDLDEHDESSSILTDVVDVNEVKQVWDDFHENADQFFFGSTNTNIELSTLHPAQAQIFKLWQIYLENVDPLLKVTHTPSLQARITDAAAHVNNLDPTLQALMFSIYCVSLASIPEDSNPIGVNAQKQELMRGYSLGCQHALLRCNFMRSNNRECLTALFLYLVSRRGYTVPESLSSMLGVAMRIAQRIGIHNESTNAKCTPFECEMRRRLWWSMVIFDNRVCEMSDYRATLLTPTWDCTIPLNINDSDIRPDMKTLPPVLQQQSDSLIIVTRSELSNIIRHTSVHLDFVNPALKKLASHRVAGSESIKLGELMENKYFKFCNSENPIHYFAMWLIRGFIAKTMWLESYSKWSNSSLQPTEIDRDTALSFTLKMLECDTKLMVSSLVERFRWQVDHLFPFPAYVFIAQELRRRPMGAHAEYAWRVMGDNYEAHFMHGDQDTSPGFRVLATVVLRAWNSCEDALKERNMPHQPPRMVCEINRRLALASKNLPHAAAPQPASMEDANIGNKFFPPPMSFMGYNPQLGINPFTMTNPLDQPIGWPPSAFAQTSPDGNPYLLDWSVMNWDLT